MYQFSSGPFVAVASREIPDRTNYLRIGARFASPLTYRGLLVLEHTIERWITANGRPTPS